MNRTKMLMNTAHHSFEITHTSILLQMERRNIAADLFHILSKSV